MSCFGSICNTCKFQLNTMVFYAVFLFMLFGMTSLGVAETRHHDSHVHGFGEMNIGVEGNNIMFELKSPAANIVGFEHAPETDQQKETVHEAVELLEKGDKLFVMSEKAGCQLHEAHVESDMETGHHDEHHEGHGEPHEEHGDHHKDHDGEHADHGDHGDAHEKESVHSEFAATYHFECSKPEMLKSINVALFEHFKGFEEIHVQLLTPKKQTAVTLTAKKNEISL